ncbi:tRNA uridine-5-carboxymethylaminomethyl(34) synthesis GTPase MnmE [Brevibacillus borstelensis]|uniref:tRNA uridine-5-carboxymethylaminomethyl(34) synthesis GTPase MnmE n=1 Tax=Brevibacillus borstelensis TaxID=45462 RepID=UPI001D09CA6F|nr:tRNA uridine-5-carboxymethylaminomethyl(34) synthesis GTPase MnmE [Brevibacillus borstelensis]MCC0566727.1 tRNA uridine-5-carboxymethylaminomethyl(34) synthesis GTPase MnmE [Brevibacillus borstelensis]MCM3473169.1 tRNA uridine-5-carboxymethylaminomethyl(34) synthesis GTPase MnmE [Brevibacillus borstelensis]MCM3561258.1 tRNA uridine-5-carboxymethylaminomethyl(34) synthesis GTPase MnmE [Brevibacillus borstelensis]MCM3592194.1 tRNA uridine-5-carboxymethylaminomethyl(34) synthesis GTPase MnmE [B
MNFDTIAAVATPMGEGGVAIIRVSGPEAIEVVDKIYRGKKTLSTVDSHTINYGHLRNPQTGDLVEEVLVSVMRAPRTFTREDVVEVNCHGGIVSVERVLELILENGARLAEPGEFTKRAFLNGRVDLSQAEAVIDLIRAKTDRAMKVALNQVEGKLSRLIRSLRQNLIEAMAHIEVTLDYPEHDVEDVTQKLLRDKCLEVKAEIGRLLQTARQGKILREGLSTAIIGRPNVGKSSLLNSLVQEEKAIVTDVAGTTRDVIEEFVNVRGVPLRLIDTAGIRETEDIVEKIGVEKSRQLLQKADLVLLVLNYNEQLTEDDYRIFEAAKGFEVILIINKFDLPQRIDLEEVKRHFPNQPLIMTSAKEETGIDLLEKAIADLFFSGRVQQDDLTYVSNARHIQLLRQAEQAIDDAVNGIEDRMPVDMVQIDIKKAWELLGEVIGESVREDLIDQIFSQFCLGK